jgi:hypothetical protein
MAMKLRPTPLEIPREATSEDENSVGAAEAATSEEPSPEEEKSPLVEPDLLSSSADVAFSSSYSTVCIAGRTFKVISIVTHLNICLYATCFWIQIGSLPVSMTLPSNDILLLNFFLMQTSL